MKTLTDEAVDKSHTCKRVPNRRAHDLIGRFYNHAITRESDGSAAGPLGALLTFWIWEDGP
jgi:hypothetical protein